MKKLLIISDAWEPQINGVVRTLQNTIKTIKAIGTHEIELIEPSMFYSVPMPGYDEIKLSLFTGKVPSLIKRADPDYVHISVEGPLGMAAKRYCNKNKLMYTTAYHTMFPEYANEKYHIPTSLGYKFVKSFHKNSGCVMVASNGLIDLLKTKGFDNTFGLWSRGVDTELFNPIRRHARHPYALYVGRVSHEKNIEAFLDSSTPGLDKVVVGSGPLLDQLKAKYPNVQFVGPKKGTELAEYYASATVFVFPSLTDTFGLVMIEALASGTPIAAYPCFNTEQVVTADVGCLDKDLSAAITKAVVKNRVDCRRRVMDHFTWDVASTQFVNNLVHIRNR